MNEHEKINYVEFPAKDIAAVKEFFTAVFDWSFEDYGPRQDGARHTPVTLRQEKGTIFSDGDERLLQAIKRGDERAFGQLLEYYHGRLMRLARTFVASDAVAEEVVQDTWIGVLEGIHRFEGRSSLKTWIYRILMNRAKTRAVREHRYVPLTIARNTNRHDSEGGGTGQADNYEEEGVEASLFGRERTPEQLLLSKEVIAQIEAVLETLPAIQRQVLILRDIEGLKNVEVAQMFNLSETNERVILHRARCKVRQALVPYLKENDKVQ